jgi:hypothetical protein
MVPSFQGEDESGNTRRRNPEDVDFKINFNVR